MTRRLLLHLGALATMLALAPACAGEPPPLTVLAASSLTEALQQAAAAWTAKGNPRVVFSFDATSRLAKQIEAGAPTDVFFAADREWMDHLDAKGLIVRASRVDLLGNTLVAVVPAGNPLGLRSAADLARPEVKHVALAGEAVPAGRYGRAALASLGAWDAIAGRVVSGDNVRTVLGWVAGGEAEAGVVYGTDARVDPRVGIAFTFPAESHPPIVYPAAVAAGAKSPEEAAQFLGFCASPEGLGIFVAAGFISPRG